LVSKGAREIMDVLPASKGKKKYVGIRKITMVGQMSLILTMSQLVVFLVK
jgi:hypothetical protein